MTIIEINGERISKKEQRELLAILRHDAEQMAGEFYEMERSDKFRVNWPDQDEFVKSEWKNFVAAIRLMYVQRLADPSTPATEAAKMHKIIVLQAMMARSGKRDDRLQIMPNTQQFMGDRTENRRTMQLFGNAPNMRALKRRVLRAISDSIH